jgi:hypothetical protein
MKIRIPTRFFDDHFDRDLPTPKYERAGKSYVVDTDDPDFAELVDDARFYTGARGPDACPPGLKAAATALLKAIDRQGKPHGT